MKLLIRGLLAFVGTCSFAALIGTIYQSRETASDLAAHPAPGRMVMVNGVNYHLLCLGTGSPTLVLEAGLGESSLSWYPVQSKLAQTTRVCSYDRAGLGWSDRVDRSMQPNEVATNLHTLLTNTGLSPPYVLMGHSRGGLFARSFYHQFPDEVKGLVLVDSVHEQGAMHQYPYAKWDYFKQGVLVALAEPLSRIGFVRAMNWANADRQPSPLPPDIKAAKTAVQNRSATAHAVANEISVMRDGLNSGTPAPTSLGNLPLLVLTSGNRIDVDLAVREARASNRSTVDATALARIQRAEQKELASLSSNARHVIVENSGHFIMYDQPDALVRAAHEFLQSIH